MRVAGLKDQIVAGIDRASMDGRTPTQQLTAIGELIPPLIERLDAVVPRPSSCPNCGPRGSTSCRRPTRRWTNKRALDTFYDERVFPVLTPLAVDPGHPFPYISDLAL